MKFEVIGNPIALKRHRYTKTGISYDPSKNDKMDFLAKCLNNRPPKPLKGAISMKLGFYFVRPKSHFGTGKNAGRLKESAPMFHNKKPDLDNLVKFVVDSLNGIFYEDDRQINNLLAYKDYDDYAHINIEITTIEG